MSHIPGPWEARWPKFDSVIVDAEDRVIASVSFNDHDDKECEANAHLIASAPELLTALKELLRITDDPARGAKGDPFDVARAVIAKAESR